MSKDDVIWANPGGLGLAQMTSSFDLQVNCGGI